MDSPVLNERSQCLYPVPALSDENLLLLITSPRWTLALPLMRWPWNACPDRGKRGNEDDGGVSKFAIDRHRDYDTVVYRVSWCFVDSLVRVAALPYPFGW